MKEEEDPFAQLNDLIRECEIEESKKIEPEPEIKKIGPSDCMQTLKFSIEKCEIY
jgi:hypothetical protein